MENNLGDILHCEEQLKTTLQCDDKEKLRRKLALLQREYLKTAQKLQRAERLDAVRKHVRSRITTENHKNQREPEVTSNPRPASSSPALDALNGAAPGEAKSLGGTAGPVDSANTPQSQTVRFLLPSDATSPSTAGQETPGGHRRSPTPRLRSRRTRLRLENRSTEAEVQEGAERDEERDKGAAKSTPVVPETEKPPSSAESESPSLLLSHWNTQMGHRKMGITEGNEERRENQAETEDKGTKRTELKYSSEDNRDDAHAKETNQEKDGDLRSDDAGKQAGEGENNQEGKGSSLLDSCTLVEGLLFPVEYYVRTTRRMSLSRSQPDVQAVILSQLGGARPRRSRGRGRGNKPGLDRTPPPGSAATPAAAETPGPEDGGKSHASSSVSPSPSTGASRGGRGRGRRRGRGRGRSHTPRRSLATPQMPLDVSTVEAPIVTPDTSILPEGFALTAEDPHNRQRPQSPAPSTEGDAPSSSAPQEKLYPIFLRSSQSRNSTEATMGAESWRSLLLPSSSPAQSSLLPLPPLQPLGQLAHLDIPQDFHLPDEHFASLKLLKLRQVAAEPAVERFTHGNSAPPPPTPTPPPSPLPCSLSLTPTLETPPSEQHQTVDPSNTLEALMTVAMETTAEHQRESQSEECQSDARALDCVCVSQTSSQDRVCEEQKSLTPENSQGGVSHGNRHISTPVKTLSLSSGAPEEDLEEVQPVIHEEEDKARTRTEEVGLPALSAVSQACEAPALIDVRTKNAGGLLSQLLMSPPPASAPAPFATQGPLPCSPPLPSLGVTPALACSPAAPPLSLPPLHSPSTQALSPPVLSPRPTPTPTPTSPPPETTAPQPETNDAEVKQSLTHRLKAPAGGFLVDACCVLGSSGKLCVAAAGKWAVCLWAQASPSHWSLTHTWTFDEPVISVFPVPDAAGLLCVTLGQLEIREVRTLSCRSLQQAALCERVVQAVVGVPSSRVVTTSHSAIGSMLQVFTLEEDSGSSVSSQPLMPPCACITAVAPVDGLSEGLIGSDEAGCLFIWNLKTGQLLRKVVLGDGLSHTACLRGYSQCGVLFVLLQHQCLSSLDDDDEPKAAEEEEEEEAGRRSTLFTLAAVNPLNGKWVPASRLHAPKSWSGRLCEADAGRCGVVGLSQSGCVCVWDVRRRSGGGGGGAARMLWAAESEGWQLARWGGGDTDALITGHHNGDVTVHPPHATLQPLP